jgi:hypothetical protein
MSDSTPNIMDINDSELEACIDAAAAKLAPAHRKLISRAVRHMEVADDAADDARNGNLNEMQADLLKALVHEQRAANLLQLAAVLVAEGSGADPEVGPGAVEGSQDNQQSEAKQGG